MDSPQGAAAAPTPRRRRRKRKLERAERQETGIRVIGVMVDIKGLTFTCPFDKRFIAMINSAVSTTYMVNIRPLRVVS